MVPLSLAVSSSKTEFVALPIMCWVNSTTFAVTVSSWRVTSSCRSPASRRRRFNTTLSAFRRAIRRLHANCAIRKTTRIDMVIARPPRTIWGAARINGHSASQKSKLSIGAPHHVGNVGPTNPVEIYNDCLVIPSGPASAVTRYRQAHVSKGLWWIVLTWTGLSGLNALPPDGAAGARTPVPRPRSPVRQPPGSGRPRRGRR
jgi:hypothetical protein